MAPGRPESTSARGSCHSEQEPEDAPETAHPLPSEPTPGPELASLDEDDGDSLPADCPPARPPHGRRRRRRGARRSAGDPGSAAAAASAGGFRGESSNDEVGSPAHSSIAQAGTCRNVVTWSDLGGAGALQVSGISSDCSPATASERSPVISAGTALAFTTEAVGPTIGGQLERSRVGEVAREVAAVPVTTQTGWIARPEERQPVQWAWLPSVGSMATIPCGSPMGRTVQHNASHQVRGSQDGVCWINLPGSCPSGQTAGFLWTPIPVGNQCSVSNNIGGEEGSVLWTVHQPVPDWNSDASQRWVCGADTNGSQGTFAAACAEVPSAGVSPVHGQSPHAPQPNGDNVEVLLESLRLVSEAYED
jgi:hypothetical protein